MLNSPIPLIYSADEVNAGRNRNALAEAARRSDCPVVRVRRGVYVHRQEWDSLRPEQRHLATVVAVMTCGNHPVRPALARESAAVVHGIPMVGALPRTVELCSWHARQGRRSATTHLTTVPGTIETTQVDGVLVTSVAQTLVDLACTRPFRSALASLDWALHEGRTSTDELEALMAAQRRRTGMSRARHALSYADGRSESVGESLSRAVMIEHRLPLPDLQHEVRSDPVVVARTDFMWEGATTQTGRPVFGEFHGRVKFGQAIAGDDPRERAAAELQRSEDIRLWTGGVVVAWQWEDALHETEMLRRLARAGVVPGPRLPAPPRQVGQ